jgi:hypothetical protein
MITAAAVPCAKRNATSAARFGAMPQAAEASTNVAVPIPKARFAPIRSAIAPDDSRNAANISV